MTKSTIDPNIMLGLLRATRLPGERARVAVCRRNGQDIYDITTDAVTLIKHVPDSAVGIAGVVMAIDEFGGVE